jgi:hypothetical protein
MFICAFIAKRNHIHLHNDVPNESRKWVYLRSVLGVVLFTTYAYCMATV